MNAIKYWLCVFGAPAVLSLVACTQIYLAVNLSLSPWKGGGFGMFSSIGSPAARFLRVYLITQHDVFPAVIPEDLNAIARELRTMPLHSGVQEFAESLASRSWVPCQSLSQWQDEQMVNAATDDTTPKSESPIQGVGRGGCLSFGDPPPYRVLEQNEIGIDSALEFTGILVEVWQYDFDANIPHLRAVKLIDISIAQ